MKYSVFEGTYPFEEQIGFVDAPADEPEKALVEALRLFPDAFHPVVEPLSALIN